MKLQQIKTRLRQPKLLSTTVQSINGGEPVRVVLVELPVETEVTKDVAKDRTFEHLFPFGHEAINKIAGREEGDRRGLDMTARGNLPELNVQISDTPPMADEQPRIAFDLTTVRVKGRPKLAIDEAGEALMHWKLRAYMTTDAVGRLGPYIDADLWLSCDASAPLWDGSNKKPGTGEQQTAPSTSTKKKTTKTRNAKDTDAKSLGPHDAIMDGVKVEVQPKAAALAEEAAKDGQHDVEEILSKARALVRLAAEPNANRVVVTVADVEEVIASLNGDEGTGGDDADADPAAAH